MKLYMHPVSMTSRPVGLFVAENNIPMDEQVVDLMTGEHYGADFTGINPSRQVPVLEDGDFRLTESSAILKYLADHNLSATEHSSGIFYIIDTPGSGGSPSAAAQVAVRHKG